MQLLLVHGCGQVSDSAGAQLCLTQLECGAPSDWQKIWAASWRVRFSSRLNRRTGSSSPASCCCWNLRCSSLHASVASGLAVHKACSHTQQRSTSSRGHTHYATAHSMRAAGAWAACACRQAAREAHSCRGRLAVSWEAWGQGEACVPGPDCSSREPSLAWNCVSLPAHTAQLGHADLYTQALCLGCSQACRAWQSCRELLLPDQTGETLS